MARPARVVVCTASTLSCRVHVNRPSHLPAPVLLHWDEQGQPRHALWRSENGAPAPRRVLLADDSLNADRAYRLVCEGTGLLWRGDFHNARQLLQALQRRTERSLPAHASVTAASATPTTPGQAFHLHRKRQAQRSRILGLLLIELGPGYRCDLRRAPDVRSACEQAWGSADGPCVVSLQALQGLIGAREWYRKGVAVAELGANIHPHYGVFSPLRGEYLSLVAQAALPAALRTHPVAMDVGTGTGVLAALLARRGIPQVIATDLSDRALACARENLQRLGLAGIRLCKTDLFAPESAALIVCNPPWLPARPVSTVEQALYDEDSRMLRGFLLGLRAHLVPGGEGWLVLSDLAEHLGLRTREQLLQWIAEAGLQVAGRLQTRPHHGKVRDAHDPLHSARAAEVTSLWRLAAA